MTRFRTPIDYQAFDRLESHLGDTKRLLEADRVLRLPRNRRVQNLIEHTANQLEVPWASLTIVTDQEQHFLASSVEVALKCGLDGTKCQYVVASRRPLAINNATSHPFWRKLVNGTTPMGKPLKAYLGVPLKVHDEVVGALCVVDVKQRTWTAQDHYTLLEASQHISKILDSDPLTA